ncbi:hypothetical protein B0H14DRAFT_2617213 [Mycena olivaceomarginata]|nr:hypothetical protein B0H14DRAFT_2617213 [Mycena olivaceomarginata]
MTAWNADSLLADPAVGDHLGKEPTISGSDREGFGKKLLLVVGTIPFIVWWSCHLAPRGEAANQYMRDANAVFLVTSIGRAIDDRDTHQYLQKHLSQIVVDGRIGKKSIALVLTGIDLMKRGEAGQNLSKQKVNSRFLHEDKTPRRKQRTAPRDWTNPPIVSLGTASTR